MERVHLTALCWGFNTLRTGPQREGRFGLNDPRARLKQAWGLDGVDWGSQEGGSVGSKTRLPWPSGGPKTVLIGPGPLLTAIISVSGGLGGSPRAAPGHHAPGDFGPDLRIPTVF